MNEHLYEALAASLQPHVLLVIVLAAAYGILIGAIPGLTATMAVALLVPLTFFLDSVSAIAAIVTTVTCSIFSGDIPAALVRIPGTPASAAYAADTYALTRRGRAEQTLGIALVFSILGGLFGVLVLMVAAPQLARLATQFTSYEYFWLYVVGLTCAAIVSDQSRWKGFLAMLLGLLLSTVGLGVDYSSPRLTFGFDDLTAGIGFIPTMIGLFGVSEVLRNALVLDVSDQFEAPPRIESAGPKRHWLLAPWMNILDGTLSLAWRRKGPLMRSSVIGSLVGMLPGAGADIAAWISYAVSKRFSREPEKYGHGSLEGVSDATGANNAAIGAAWIPALVFGIPGDSVTAIAIGVLLMKNIRPGPNIFNPASSDNQLTLVFSLYVVFLLAHLVLLPIGLLAIRGGTLLIRVPRRVLLPLVLMFCIVGSYALNASYFDVGTMLAMGVLGFALERVAVPLGPVVLGIILGGEVEHKFIQCLTKSSSAAMFLDSWISKLLVASIVALWFGPALRRALARK